MVDYVTSDPNLKTPHQYGPPTMSDVLFDYYAKQQYPAITPLVHPDAEIEEADKNYEAEQENKE